MCEASSLGWYDSKNPLTIILNEGLQWNDGRLVSIGDFQFTLKVMQKAPPTHPAFAFFQRIKAIKSAPPGIEIQWQSEGPWANEAAWFFLLPQHIEKAIWKDAPTWEDYLQASSYTIEPKKRGLYLGPFIPNQISRQQVSFLPNPHAGSRKGQSKITLAYLDASPPAAHTELVVLSELFFPLPFPDVRLPQGWEITRHDSLFLELLSFNLRNPELRDKHLRKALRYAFDPGTLVDDVLGRHYITAVSFIHPALTGLEPTIPYYVPDATKVQQHLKAGHWHHATSEGILQKGTKKLNLILMTDAHSPRERLAKHITASWANHDLPVKLELVTQAQRKHRISRLDYDGIALFTYELPVLSDFAPMFASDAIPNATNAYRGGNVSAWSTATLTKLYHRDRLNALTPTSLPAFLKDLQHHYSEELPSIPLFFHSHIAAIKPGLMGFKVPLFGLPSSSNAKDWRFKPQAQI
jgi:ABC-type transport system substrate-binding protein